jgi:hypothetical protein
MDTWTVAKEHRIKGADLMQSAASDPGKKKCRGLRMTQCGRGGDAKRSLSSMHHLASQ